MSINPLISLIIISKNEGHYLKQTIDQILNQRNESSYEILIVDDGSTDNSCRFLNGNAYKDIRLIKSGGVGPSRARNIGVHSSCGQYLIFLDAHVVPSKAWLDHIIQRFSAEDIHALAPVLGQFNPTYPSVYGLKLGDDMQPYWITEIIDDFSPIAFAGTGCLAIRRQTFLDVGAFDEGFRIMGLEDIDLCLRLWTFGYNLYLDPRVKILHKFRSIKPYPVQDFNIMYNFLRLAFKHYNEQRLIKAVDIAKGSEHFGKLLLETMASDVWKQRMDIKSKRSHDDVWFFEKFSIKI